MSISNSILKLVGIEDKNIKIKVLAHKPFEGPIEIEVEETGEKMGIGYKAAHYIFVK